MSTPFSLPRSSVTILDGGMGHTLRRMGCGIEIAGKVGSIGRFNQVALANIHQPQLVISAHKQFLEAGADVITTNNYGAVPMAFSNGNANSSSDDTTNDDDTDIVGKLIDAAVDCAVEAREEYYNDNKTKKRHVRIAASLPPLKASYRPDQVASFDENVSIYRQLVRQLLTKSQHIDIFLCETMSTVDEARAAATAVVIEEQESCHEGMNKIPLWVSWTLRPDGKLRSGESIKHAVQTLLQAFPDPDKPNILQACLFNCCTVEAIDMSLDELVSAAVVPGGCEVGAYPNSFAEQRVLNVGSGSTTNASPTVETTTTTSVDDVKNKDNDDDDDDNNNGEYRDDLSPIALSKVAQNWIDNKGCTIIGGCCGIFPEHIQELASSLSLSDDQK